MSRNIKCIALDVGGVLIDDGFYRLYIQLAAKLPISYDHFDEIFIRCDVARQLRIDATSLQNYWDNADSCIRNAYGVSLLSIFRSTDALNEALFSGFVLKPYTYSLMKYLSDQNFVLVTFSNEFREKYEYLKRRYNFYNHVAYNFLSFEVGFAKPDPRFFAHALCQLPFNAGNILFVDDRRGNLDAAASMGFAVFHARRNHLPPLDQALLDRLGLRRPLQRQDTVGRRLLPKYGV